MGPLGLIAGEGILPVLIARGARAAGRRVVCIGLAGNAMPQLADECDEFRWVGILRMGRWIRTLRRWGCHEAIMAGRVQKTRMYARGALFRYIPDLRTLRIWFGKLRHDKRPYAILKAIVDEMEAAGIPLIDSTAYTKDQLATPGTMTRLAPTDAQWADIRFGLELCRTVSRLDIGQSIAVLNRDVIAVEALEGTNAMIERAGQLCRAGRWTLIKVANSRQDMRVDVPSIGMTTIEKAAVARVACIAVEVGKTIFLEKQKVLELAEKHGIAVVGVE